MSEKSEGPGWWIASDGQWYPPELHPSVRKDNQAKTTEEPPVNTTPSRRWNDQPEKAAHVGPQFPDLFQKALQGSHLADNISVNYTGDNDRRSPDAPNGGRTTGSVPSSTTPAGASTGPTAKRRWRKGN